MEFLQIYAKYLIMAVIALVVVIVVIVVVGKMKKSGSNSGYDRI